MKMFVNRRAYGSHDEWNIVRSINQKRRNADGKSGLSAQLGVMFDGYPNHAHECAERRNAVPACLHPVGNRPG